MSSGVFLIFRRQCLSMYRNFIGAVVLGDPSGGIEIEGISQASVRNAELTSITPGKLATNLLVALFTPEELATKNCTDPTREDIGLLDQTKIHAIRGMCIILKMQ